MTPDGCSYGHKSDKRRDPYNRIETTLGPRTEKTDLWILQRRAEKALELISSDVLEKLSPEDLSQFISYLKSVKEKAAKE